MMPLRTVYRYEVPIDDKPHRIQLSSSCLPIAVAAVTLDGSATSWIVEFWAEHNDAEPLVDHVFQVFGTGHPVPAGARWRGTCPRLFGLVWHLYEIEG
jgi:hypothetical protein